MREIPDARVATVVREHRELAIYAMLYQYQQITYEEALVRMIGALHDKLVDTANAVREGRA